MGTMVRMFEAAITEGCRKTLESLGQYDFVNQFYLAGGTALALQLGHRVSTDLDWFSTSNPLTDVERAEIHDALSRQGDFEVASEQDGMLFAKMFDTDVSFIHQPHPLLESTINYGGVQLASPTDIGLMKLAAINARGTRRDFIDVYCLRNTISLDRLLELAGTKYSNRPSFLAVASRALSYFDDAEQQPMPELLHPVSWEDVRDYCEAAARQLARRLSGLI